jgi:redox-sensing transcriptional repressor
MSDRNIPDIVVGRLPRYLLALQRLHSEGARTTSSQELGEKLGLTAAQIRKDLSQFGEFGKQGTGYSVQYLIDQLSKISKDQSRMGYCPDRRRQSGACHRPLSGF